MILASFDPGPTARFWLLKVAGAFLLLATAAYVLQKNVSLPYARPITADEQATQIMDDYHRRPAADVLLVGTSLLYHLKEEYFDRPGVRNISMPGQSVLTGLEVAATQRVFPKILIIEDNILVRLADAKIVANYSFSAWNLTPFLIHPSRILIGFLISHSTTRSLTQKREWVAARLASPPGTTNVSAELVNAWEVLDLSPAPALAAQMVDLAKQFASRGVKVAFIRMPWVDELERTSGNVKSRDIARQLISQAGFKEIHLDLDRSELRWDDGAHLDSRSAILVSKAVEKAIGEMKQ